MTSENQNPQSENETGSPKQGLIVVFTGNGKGKTTAGLGTVLRAVGYGHRCLIVQFVKGSWNSGEMKSIERLAPEVEFHRMGKGFVGIMDDTLPMEDHIQAAQHALNVALEKMLSGNYRLIMLDEINVAVKLGLIETKQVLNLLDQKPQSTSLILTGRDAPDEIISRADTVTEMREIKHAYQKGILALQGVDY
jgi:cob(I)alamin adenosyltransferase